MFRTSIKLMSHPYQGSSPLPSGSAFRLYSCLASFHMTLALLVSNRPGDGLETSSNMSCLQWLHVSWSPKRRARSGRWRLGAFHGSWTSISTRRTHDFSAGRWPRKSWGTSFDPNLGPRRFNGHCISFCNQVAGVIPFRKVVHHFIIRFESSHFLALTWLPHPSIKLCAKHEGGLIIHNEIKELCSCFFIDVVLLPWPPERRMKREDQNGIKMAKEVGSHLY